MKKHSFRMIEACLLFPSFLVASPAHSTPSQASTDKSGNTGSASLSSIPDQLTDSYRACAQTDATGSHETYRKALIATCEARHRLIIALSEDRHLRRESFNCSVRVSLNMAEAGQTPATELHSGGCHVPNLKLHARLEALLSNTKFAALDPEFGTSLRLFFEMRSQVSRELDVREQSSTITKLRSGGRDYWVRSEMINFSNLPKMLAEEAARRPPPLLPPGPNCTSCGTGSAAPYWFVLPAATRPSAVAPQNTKIDHRLAVASWRRKVAGQLEQSLLNDPALSAKLRKDPYRLILLLAAGPDGRIARLGIKDMFGSVSGKEKHIKALLVNEVLPPFPQNHAAESFTGLFTIRFRGSDKWAW